MMTLSVLFMAFFPCSFGSVRRAAQPRHRAEAILTRPELIERRGVVEISSFHHEADREEIAQVLRRIGIEDHQVGDLSRPDRADRMVKTVKASSIQARNA